MADAAPSLSVNCLGSRIRVVVKLHLQPIGYFVAAVCLLLAPFAVTEGWPRLLLIAVFTLPACLAVWLGIEHVRDRWRDMEND
jgi:hypothetical protein